MSYNIVHHDDLKTTSVLSELELPPELYLLKHPNTPKTWNVTLTKCPTYLGAWRSAAALGPLYSFDIRTHTYTLHTVHTATYIQTHMHKYIRAQSCAYACVGAGICVCVQVFLYLFTWRSAFVELLMFISPFMCSSWYSCMTCMYTRAARSKDTARARHEPHPSKPKTRAPKKAHKQKLG